MPRMKSVPKKLDLAATGLVKKKRRTKWKTNADRQIRRELKSVRPAINRTAFKRLVKEMAQEMGSAVRWERGAIDALQAAAEPHAIRLLSAANSVAVYGTGKPTLRKPHVDVVKRILGIMET